MRQPLQASRFNHHNLISTPSQLAVALVSHSVTVCSLLGPKVREQNQVRPATGELESLALVDESQDSRCDVERAALWQ